MRRVLIGTTGGLTYDDDSMVCGWNDKSSSSYLSMQISKPSIESIPNLQVLLKKGHWQSCKQAVYYKRLTSLKAVKQWSSFIGVTQEIRRKVQALRILKSELPCRAGSTKLDPVATVISLKCHWETKHLNNESKTVYKASFWETRWYRLFCYAWTWQV